MFYTINYDFKGDGEVEIEAKDKEEAIEKFFKVTKWLEKEIEWKNDYTIKTITKRKVN